MSFNLRMDIGGWGFSSVVDRLPRKRKALGSVPSSEKKNQKKKKKNGYKKCSSFTQWNIIQLLK